MKEKKDLTYSSVRERNQVMDCQNTPTSLPSRGAWSV
jgi:hypothetical protein